MVKIECRLVLDQEYMIALLAGFEDGKKSESRTLICFPEGTDREEIWKWYDNQHPKGVAYLFYGEDRRRKRTNKIKSKVLTAYF